VGAGKIRNGGTLTIGKKIIGFGQMVARTRNRGHHERWWLRFILKNHFYVPL
jgi:hypothetical protein